MKREINFRAIVPINSNGPKTMRYFDLSKDDDLSQLAVADYDINGLMQFTGLHDKNGKEIYESDWVKDSIGSMGVVEYSNDKMMFQFQIKKYENQGAWQHPVNSGFDSETLEVIGNIYEGRQEK